MTYTEKWNDLAPRAKVGIAVGTLLIIALTIGLAIWIYRPNYQVLFAEVSSTDAAAMTAELERMKVPYRLENGGNTILVPQDLVYKTRLKLMGNDLPLRGAVGFEVFNNADFGMTEFVQKVNYQRAIQGELTRTIMSIEDVQSARVHLAVPEQGLFKKATSKSKASVTVTMKAGKALVPEQIAGIQRLVAASVPEIAASDVTIVDQHGIALTRVAPSEQGMEAVGTHLDSKKSTEDYLVRKVTQVLDRTFGPGEAIATVDVVLNMDQTRVTTEDVLPARAPANALNEGGTPTGVIVRERQTSADNSAAGPTASSREAQHTVTSIESDYQVGRRVEQTVSAPGATQRMTVTVVVKKSLSDAQTEKLKEVVGAASGFNSQRGDNLVVYSLDRITETAASGAEQFAALPPDLPPAGNLPGRRAGTMEEQVGENRSFFMLDRFTVGIVAILFAVMAGAAGLAMLQMRKKKQSAYLLGAAGREEVLRDIRLWIEAMPSQSVGQGARL